jgi:hypothetical protein
MTASANPRCRLAPRTSSQECVPTMQNSFKTTFNSIPKRLDADGSCNCSPLSITLGDIGRSKKHSANHPTVFNIHNSLQHHRDRSACGFLLTLKSEAPRKQIFSTNHASCARRFRCCVAVIRQE